MINQINHMKSIEFYNTMIKISSKNYSKRFKTVRNDIKWFQMINLCDHVIQKIYF